MWPMHYILVMQWSKSQRFIIVEPLSSAPCLTYPGQLNLNIKRLTRKSEYHHNSPSSVRIESKRQASTSTGLTYQRGKMLRWFAASFNDHDHVQAAEVGQWRSNEGHMWRKFVGFVLAYFPSWPWWQEFGWQAVRQKRRIEYIIRSQKETYTHIHPPLCQRSRWWSKGHYKHPVQQQPNVVFINIRLRPARQETFVKR